MRTPVKMNAQRNMRGRLLPALAALVALSATGTAQAAVTVWDDYSSGFSQAKWFHHPTAPGFVPADGVVATAPGRLEVRSEPFTLTMPQEDDNAFGVHGQFDHHKWLALMNHRAASGVPGFDAPAGDELAFEATISGRTSNTAAHPFGNAVVDPEDDQRLAAAVVRATDPETHMEFDFVVTNRRIYAGYARTPYGRTPSENYASFRFLVPLGTRATGDRHRVAIAYDRAAGTVRWLVDGSERLSVSRIGHRIDRRHMVLDQGGAEQTVVPRQLDAGMGLTTMLDATLPGGPAGLARLSNLPYFYFDPRLGEPVPQLMVDNSSFDGNRVYGQGARLSVGPFVVSTDGPACSPGGYESGLLSGLLRTVHRLLRSGDGAALGTLLRTLNCRTIVELGL
jgi:hypothetical protein